MPLKSLTRGYAFEPEVLLAMGRAFDETLAALRLTDREDPATTLVGRTIVELAKAGEHDADRMRDRAIRELSGNNPSFKRRS